MNSRGNLNDRVTLAAWQSGIWLYIRRHGFFMWAAIVIAVTGVALVALTHPPQQPSDWAAWAQAFGALMALGVAVFMQHAVSHSQTVKANSAAVVLAEHTWNTLVEMEVTCRTEELEKLSVQVGKLRALRALSHQIRVDSLSVAIMSDFISIVALQEEAEVVATAPQAAHVRTDSLHLAKHFEEIAKTCATHWVQMQRSGVEWHDAVV